MEEDGHVVFIIGGIEARDIDERVAHTVTIILGVQRRSTVIVKPYSAIIPGILDPSGGIRSCTLDSCKEKHHHRRPDHEP